MLIGCASHRDAGHRISPALLLLATAVLPCCGGDRDTQSSPEVQEPQPIAQGLSPIGSVASAQPEFSWPLLTKASEYQLVVQDDSGNLYKQILPAAQAGCDDQITSCRATPPISYYNQSLVWRVDAVVGGKTIPLTSPIRFTTPVDNNIQPVTDNAAVCDVWPTLVYDRFAVLNNIWNAGTVRSDDWRQTIAATQSSENTFVASWLYDWLEESRGVPHAVKAYPEVVYGNKLGTLVTGSKARTGLPERIDKLDQFNITYRYSETGKAERNVAIESFFHDSCEITGPCHRQDNRAYEMMVWINNPRSWKPGDLALSGVKIDGLLWDVYIKPRSNKEYIAFAAVTPQTEGTLHWNQFVDWTVDWTTENSKELGIEPMTPDLCMGAIEFGTELWSGSGTFTLDQYDISFDR